MRHSLVVATTNVGKVSEFADLLADLPIALKSLREFPGCPEIPEEGTTYTANASRKALTIAQWTGIAALADDSGLEVDALEGAPGVHSARYAGQAQDAAANITKLLAALKDVPTAQRSARFRCAIAVARPDGATFTADGVCEGRITDLARGSGGFGYDPVFLYPPIGQTFGEASAAVKNRLSHRARACERLRPHLIAFLSGRQ